MQSSVSENAKLDAKFDAKLGIGDGNSVNLPNISLPRLQMHSEAALRPMLLEWKPINRTRPFVLGECQRATNVDLHQVRRNN
jgi:hypothetical protein